MIYLDLKYSKPSSWYIFSVEIALVAPAIAKHALYWIDSSLSWKAEFYIYWEEMILAKFVEIYVKDP